MAEIAPACSNSGHHSPTSPINWRRPLRQRFSVPVPRATSSLGFRRSRHYLWNNDWRRRGEDCPEFVPVRVLTALSWPSIGATAILCQEFEVDGREAMATFMCACWCGGCGGCRRTAARSWTASPKPMGAADAVARDDQGALRESGAGTRRSEAMRALGDTTCWALPRSPRPCRATAGESAGRAIRAVAWQRHCYARAGGPAMGGAWHLAYAGALAAGG